MRLPEPKTTSREQCRWRAAAREQTARPNVNREGGGSWDTGGSIWAVITRRLAGARMHACPSVLVSLKEAPPRFPPHWPFEALVLPRLMAPFGGCLLNLHQISRSVSGFSPATFFCRVSATHHGRFQFFCDSAVQSWVLFSSS